MAEPTPITSRFFGIEQAARRLGDQELEYCLIEGTLPAWQRDDFLIFEELDRFRKELLLRGVHRDHLDAVRAAVQGTPIPGYCWRRWFAMDIVSLETGRVVLQFPGYRQAVVFQPQVQSTDVLRLQARAAPPVVKTRPAPSPPAAATGDIEAPADRPMGTAEWIANEAKRLKAANKIPDHITDFAKLLETQMAEAAVANKSLQLRPVGWQHIKNELPGWGLWPSSLIKS